MVPIHPAAIPTVPAGRASAPDLNQVARWAEIALARPLFSPGRRPPAVTHGAAPAAEAPPALPRVAGVMVTPAGRRVIFSAKDAKPVVVGEGGRVGAFTVQSIRAGQVTVEGPGGVRVLGPSFDPEAPVPAPAGALPPSLPTGLPGGLPGGLAIPGLPGIKLAPQPQGLGGVPGLGTPPVPGVVPRNER